MNVLFLALAAYALTKRKQIEIVEPSPEMTAEQQNFLRKMETVYFIDAQGNKVPKPNLIFPIQVGFDKYLVGFRKRTVPFTTKIYYQPIFQNKKDVVTTTEQSRF